MSAPAPTPGRLWRKAALVWLGLTLLLAATLFAAYLPLGQVKIAVSLGIAAAKAALVALVFMELAADGPLTRMAAAAGLIFLAILLSLTLAEEATRSHVLSLFGAG